MIVYKDIHEFSSADLKKAAMLPPCSSHPCGHKQSPPDVEIILHQGAFCHATLLFLMRIGYPAPKNRMKDHFFR